MSTVPERVERLGKRLLHAGFVERIAIAIGTVVLALFIGSIIVVAAGHDAGEFLYYLVYGAFGTMRRLGETLRHTTLLIIAGVAIAIAFRAHIFNIGVQGQLLVGGFAAAMTIILLAPVFPAGALGGVLLVGASFVAGIIAGGAYAALPGLMKAYADANEVITTIMLNFIALGVLFVLVDGPVKDPAAPAPRTERFPDYVSFPQYIMDTGRFSFVALAIVLVVVVLIYVLISNTKFGYDLRTTGHQAAAADYSGVDANRMIVSTMTLSGMVAGLGGAVFVIMTHGYFGDPNGVPVYGFDGIAVSLLAANNPLGVIPAGLLFGGLASGGSYVDVMTGVPQELVDGIVGLIILFVAAPEMFRMAGRRLGWGDD